MITKDVFEQENKRLGAPDLLPSCKSIALGFGAFALLAVTGCASVQAKGPVDRPALMVPPPPARIVEPAEVIPEPVGELPPVNSGASRSPRPTSTKPEAKAEPPAEVSPKPEPSKPAEAKADAPPAAQLRTPQTADTSSAARAVRTMIDTARGILNGVNFGPLSNARKKAYNDAKLFLQQAEDALKEGNLAFAQGVANKAETLARELAGR